MPDMPPASVVDPAQPSLFADEPPVWATDAIGRRWWTFHRAHPEVGREFVRLAREWRHHQPGSRIGAKAIFEVLRWHHAIGAIPTTADEPFRLNGSYTALYSRWAMEHHPDLAAVFELRERKALVAA